MIFSVVIPVYNVGRLVQDALDSLLSAAAAAKVEVECICVDDGSTDDSAAVLDAFARRSPSVRVIRQENAGVASARNRGLEAARGEWLLFLDADDVVRKSLFTDLTRAAAEHPEADLLTYGIEPFYEERVNWSEASDDWTDAAIGDELCNALSARSFCQFAYRRDVHGQARFESLLVGEDMVFCVGALARSRSCAMTDRREYGYRFRANSATHAPFTERKMMDVIAFNVAMFRMLGAAHKRIGSGFWMGRGYVWIEGLPRELLRNWRRTPGFAKLWSAWIDSMAVASTVPCLSKWQRFAAGRVSRARSIFVCRLVCLLPAWLARKGILHRHKSA